MMATVNVGAPLEYGRPQGVLRRSVTLGLVDCNPAAMTAEQGETSEKGSGE